MFIRPKTFSGKNGRQRTYYYLVEDIRENGRVKQHVIAYLGRYPTIQAAIKGITADIEKLSQRLTEYRQIIAEHAPRLGDDMKRLKRLRRRPGPDKLPAHRLLYSLKWLPTLEKRLSELESQLAKIREVVPTIFAPNRKL